MHRTTDVCFQGKSGHRDESSECLLLTRSGQNKEGIKIKTVANDPNRPGRSVHPLGNLGNLAPRLDETRSETRTDEIDVNFQGKK